MVDMAEGVIVTAWMLLAMLVPAGLLWTAMRVYDLVMDHRDRQRRRRVRRAMRAAQTTILKGAGAELVAVGKGTQILHSMKIKKRLGGDPQ